MALYDALLNTILFRLLTEYTFHKQIFEFLIIMTIIIEQCVSIINRRDQCFTAPNDLLVQEKGFITEAKKL